MENFSVFLSGTKSNSESGRVALKNSLVEVLCLENDEAEMMVENFPTEVESNLSRDSAQALAEILESLGAITEIRDVLGKIITEVEITPYVDTTPSPTIEIIEEEVSLEDALEDALALFDGSGVNESIEDEDHELEKVDVADDLPPAPPNSISSDLSFSDDSEFLNLDVAPDMKALEISEEPKNIPSSLNFEDSDQKSIETPSISKSGEETDENELIDTSLLDLSLSFEDEVIEKNLNSEIKIERKESNESSDAFEKSSLALGAEEDYPIREIPITESNKSSAAKDIKKSILQDASENEELDNAFREKMQREMLSTKEARIKESIRLSKSHKAISQNIKEEKQEIFEEKKVLPSKTKRPTGRLSRNETSIDAIKDQKKNQTLLAVLTVAVLVLMYLFMPSDSKKKSSDVINPELVKILLQAQKKQTVETEETPDPNRKRTFEASLNNVTWKNKTSLTSVAGGLLSLDLEFTVHTIPKPEPEEFLKKEFKPHLVSLALNFQAESSTNAQMSEHGQLSSVRLYVQHGTERKRLTSPMIIKFEEDGKLLKLVSSISEEMLAPGTYFIDKSPNGDLVLKMHLIIPLKETAPVEIIRSTKGINKKSEQKDKSATKKSKKSKKSKKVKE